MYAGHMNGTFLTSNIYIEVCFPKALALTQLWSYEMLKVLLIGRINNSVGIRRILNFRMLCDAFPYRLVREIPLKEGVSYLVQSEVRTPPHHLRWTILALQISLNE
jgi:hypothetical protein